MLSKKNRIKKATEYRSVFRGKRIVSDHFSIFFLRKNLNLDTKFGFIITKKYGKATKRNKIKRRISFICRDFLKIKPYGFDVVIKVMPSASSLNYESINKEIFIIFNKIIGK